MSDVKEINLETGEEIIREYTQDEIAQANADEQAAENERAAKEGALAKLEKLGLSVSDLEALGLL